MPNVDIRKKHPTLYHAIMVFAFMKLALALNFWLYKPTFNPYHWNKTIIGFIFFFIGSSQLIFLNIVKNLRLIRFSLALAVSFMFFWGLSNTQQFFAGKASLQLPILYLAVAIVQVPLLIEAPVNPMTEKE